MALIWSLVSSSQIIDSIKVVDNNSQKKHKADIWAKASLLELGIGGYFIESESLNKNSGVFGQFSLLPLSMGTSYLGGLGLGTKLGEYFILQDIVEINTIAPIYVYFPIYMSKKEGKDEGSIPSMVNLYAGGSLWCIDSNSSSYSTMELSYPQVESYSQVEILQATKYIHVGINYMFYNYSFDNRFFGKGNFSLDSGMLFYETKGEGFKNSFHIGLLYNLVASVKKYKE